MVVQSALRDVPYSFRGVSELQIFLFYGIWTILRMSPIFWGVPPMMPMGWA